MTTEVYSCKEGQALRDGKLDYAPDITDKSQAEADAKRRCQRDASIRKVAYYSVTEDGRFRNFHTYTNPNPGGGGGAKAPAPKKKPVTRKAPPPKPSLWRKIKRALGLG